MNNPKSVAGGKLEKASDLRTALGEIAEAGFEYIDFWLCRYCDGDDAPMRLKNWESFVNDADRAIKDAGLKVGQCHAYWRHKHEIAEDFSFSMPSALTMRNFDACAMLGCRRLVFHPLQRWMSVPDEETLDRIIGINAEWFGSMLPHAAECGVDVHVENLFDHKHKTLTTDPFFPFARAKDLLRLHELIGSDRVFFCLDTGHANIARQDIPAMIRALGPRIGALHLNDNYGKIAPVYEDLHLFPGYGRIDWKPVFSALRDVGYGGTINIEPNGELGRMPHEIRVIMLRAAGQILDYMKDSV
ncbi:MAG: sugar phosphate isomerase/epimerase [Clostridia bacterium]|nr:sugar phosphate isomerase/epimerase [Clostridia bacterium]